MSIADACAQWGADIKNEVMHDTWGHLGPTSGKHSLIITLAYSEFGDTVMVNTQHPTLEESPWHHANMQKLVNELTDGDDIEQGGVYRFEGTCTYGYTKEDVQNEFRDRISDCEYDAERDALDGKAKLEMLKTMTGQGTAEEMLEAHSLEHLNTCLKACEIDELSALHVITMTDWEGDITTLVEPV